jgi:hypothetical protein
MVAENPIVEPVHMIPPGDLLIVTDGVSRVEMMIALPVMLRVQPVTGFVATTV